MKRLLSATILPLVCMTMTHCGSGRTLLLDQRGSEATMLKANVQALGAETPETRQADSLAALGAMLVKKGGGEQAAAILDKAVILYRLEIAKSHYAASLEERKRLDAGLRDAQGKLAMYEKILKELQK